MIKTQQNIYDSSTVVSSVYDFKTEELIVAFKFGEYSYKDVSLEDYDLFADADSQGTGLNKYIKGKYKYEKIEETK